MNAGRHQAQGMAVAEVERLQLQGGILDAADGLAALGVELVGLSV